MGSALQINGKDGIFSKHFFHMKLNNFFVIILKFSSFLFRILLITYCRYIRSFYITHRRWIKKIILVAFVFLYYLLCWSQCCDLRMFIPNPYFPSWIPCLVSRSNKKGRKILCLVSFNFYRLADPHHLDVDPDPHQRLFETATTGVQTIQGSSLSLYDYF